MLSQLSEEIFRLVKLTIYYERLVTMNSINIEKLEKLAALSVNTGVGLQRGQNLLITAPSDSLPLVRLIAVSYTHLRAHET